MLTNSEEAVKYTYSHIWTTSQSFSRPTPPTVRWLRFSRYGSLSASNDQEKVACPNEVLSDYLVKIRLQKGRFARLFCENQIVKSEVLSV